MEDDELEGVLRGMSAERSAELLSLMEPDESAEDSPGDEELGKAVTLLSYTAMVLLFSHRDQWLPRFRRAA